MRVDAFQRLVFRKRTNESKSTLELIQSRKPRFAMDPEVYNSDVVYQDDLQYIWYATWILPAIPASLKRLAVI